MKRKFLVVITCLLAVLGLQVVSLNPANAWSGHLPQCGTSPYDWQSAIEADSRFNSATAWVTFKRNWPYSPYYGKPALVVVWNPTASRRIAFVGNGVDDSANGLETSKAGTSYYQVTATGIVDITSSMGYGWDFITPADLNCIQDVHNVLYHNWVGLHYTDTVANSQGPFTYVAMGDSYSSGEGNPPFEPGTDDGGVNECHRSSMAYPRLLQNDSSLALGQTAFVACSFATTSNVLYGGSGVGGWDEGPQVDALSGDTQVVTITIGGNDVGFVDYATSCALWVCGPGTSAYTTISDKITDPAFQDSLETTYLQILNDAPNAEVYVADYPYLSAADATLCGVVDFSGARDVHEALNYVIWAAVYDVGETSSRIHYVNTNTIGSPFEGKHLCNGGESDFNGVELPKVYSFHPNVDGQEDYAAVIADALSL